MGGGYLVLFSLCMYTVSYKKGIIRKMHYIAMISLFTLATIGFILDSSGRIFATRAIVFALSLSHEEMLRLYSIVDDIALTLAGLYYISKHNVMKLINTSLKPPRRRDPGE
ncbi:hypothetical protein D9758_009791 [Tetrapyrgos nigripes]|uniref:Uncharacterized protein n=1 Tax=Tetrapyrgos nigripes TaxID=182062 RepID=A0A8H5GJY3_9AGAR|nr:hypothetical protein D9758_009791 [Tetrapyrgos nigripes]